MEIRLQTHTHTIFSRRSRILYDSVIEPKEYVDILKANNLHGVIADHNSTEAYSQIRKYAEEQGVVLVNALEADTVDCHIIGIGVPVGIEKELNKRMSTLEVADKFRAHGAVIYAPHICSMYGIGSLVKDIPDCVVEVINGNNSNLGNYYSRLLAEKYNLPMAVGSDAHVPERIPYNITVIEAEPDEDSIIKALKNGKQTIKRFENVKSMSLREKKDYVLEKICKSQDDMRMQIEHGWREHDSRAMMVANTKFARLIEKGALNLCLRNRRSHFWNLLACASYGVYSLVEGWYFYKTFSKELVN